MGRVIRVNLDKFTLADTATVDVAAVDNNARGYVGGFTDGRYGYLAPYKNAYDYHGRVARIDLQYFTTGGVTILNLQDVDARLSGFRGGFTDGRHAYFVPYENYSGPVGRLARVDIANFTSGGVTVLDLAAVDPNLVKFGGSFTSGRYAWLVTFSYSITKIARVDLANFTTGGVTVLDLTTFDPSLTGFSGAFTDGRYGYLIPYLSAPGVPAGRLVRIDLADFTESGVTVLDLTSVSAALKGFVGGFTDGRYAWLAPHTGTTAARIDLANFTPSGVTAVDLAAFDHAATKFASAFTNGRFGVLVPTVESVGFGTKLMRIQLFQGPGSL
jgi:hypothetical protein